jgi:hypothetical protein
MKQLSKQKQALVLAALREGAPLNSVTRMFNVSIHTVLRVIRDTGEMFADYMDRELRGLPCKRIEMDESGNTSAHTRAGCRKTIKPSAAIIGCGPALMPIRSWSFRIASGNAVGLTAMSLLATCASA